MSILEGISSYIKDGESASHNLGLEIEHFVVDENGTQIGFGEISALIDSVGKELNAEIHYMDGYPVGYHTKGYTVSLEPACQFEISIDPYSDLKNIRTVYKEFRNTWDPVFEREGYHFETKGNLPNVELGLLSPGDIPLSPKKRYQFMNSYFNASGKYGKYMMRASASAQISVDYASEEDMVRKLRVLQKISPLLMILMENKTKEESTLPGATGKPHLLRIQEWDDLDPDRTGFVPYSFDEDFGYEKMAEVIYKTPLILLSDEGETIDVGHLSAEDLIKKHVIYEEGLKEERKKRLIEHFMSMGFFHFRVKQYIEIRVADSVPINKALGYAALIKGIVYSEELLEEIDETLADLNSIDSIQKAVERIEKDGFDAIFYDGRTAGDWAEYILRKASGNLSDEEKEYINYVRVTGDIGEKQNTRG